LFTKQAILMKKVSSKLSAQNIVWQSL